MDPLTSGRVIFGVTAWLDDTANTAALKGLFCSL